MYQFIISEFPSLPYMWSKTSWPVRLSVVLWVTANMVRSMLVGCSEPEQCQLNPKIFTVHCVCVTRKVMWFSGSAQVVYSESGLSWPCCRWAASLRLHVESLRSFLQPFLYLYTHCIFLNNMAFQFLLCTSHTGCSVTVCACYLVYLLWVFMQVWIVLN